jgi:DNA-3-methyladenine glycosylase II
MLYEKTFALAPRPPFRLDLTVWTLRRRKNNRIDDWNNGTYARVFAVGGTAIQCTVEQRDGVLQVTIKSLKPLENVQPVITDTLKKMLGLNLSLRRFYDLAYKDSHIQTLVEPFVGMRPPRFPSLFEAMLNAIACQQVSLDVGMMLLSRLAEQYGQQFTDEEGSQYAFPVPEELAAIPEEEIKKLGFSYQKARTIHEVAQQFLTEKTVFDELENKTNEEIIAFLSSLRGIGRWSSEYVLLRGLGRLDVLPGDDVGAQKNLQQLLGLQKRPNYDEIHQLVKKWQPYAGLVYFHLLLEKLQEKHFYEERG